MQLFAHQEAILKRNPERHLLAFGTGTGKTLTSIMLAKHNRTHFMVIVPKALITNWKREIARWYPEAMDYSVYREYKAKNPQFKLETAIYLVITKETFRRDYKKLPKFNCVIVDETHYFANSKSAMTKALLAYLKVHQVQFRWLLTASPFLKDAWNIYTLASLLGTSWNYVSFKHKFFYEVPMGMKKDANGRVTPRMIPQARPGMEDEVAALVAAIGTTVKMEDCIDMPEAIFEKEEFTLTKEQEKEMKQIMDPQAIVRFTKLHQISGGSLKGNEYEPDRVFDSEKVDRIREIVEENKKVIISCRYLSEIAELERTLISSAKKIFVITGATKDKQAVLDEFERSEEGIILVNAMCSEGWQAPSCQLIVFFSLDFSYKNFLQMCGRIRRIDRPQRVTYLTLTTKDSVDEDVAKAIERKEDFHLAIYNFKDNVVA